VCAACLAVLGSIVDVVSAEASYPRKGETLPANASANHLSLPQVYLYQSEVQDIEIPAHLARQRQATAAHLPRSFRDDDWPVLFFHA
jgi:hypothetical protein